MKSLLIANRGEIAVRIIRTARVLGIRTVLICSEIDQFSLAAKLADSIVILPGNSSSETYLNVDAVVRVAIDSKVEAIHPGYGFLSERAEFSEEAAKNKITFIGPSAKSMRLLGDKVSAKQLAESIGIPLVPGYYKPHATDEELQVAAKSIGFPLLAKASAGGGGRGMRVIEDAESLLETVKLARDEAKRSFGNDEMMLEKVVAKPRHIETQFIADSHGNIAVLFERECSLQRRRQKVVEEAGSPYPEYGSKLWPKMREATIKIVKAAGYVGAGTAEFLVDDQSGEFYFLEVNARLQVEHPVTEMVSGLDLVKAQIDVANGLALDLSKGLMEGDRTCMTGHAVEARIIAENPEQGFLPSIGKILGFAPPAGPGIRVDSGFMTGDIVSEYYDSLLAKLVAWGPTREHAILRLKSALLDFHVLGIATNIGYLVDVVNHPQFTSADFDVNWLERSFGDWRAPNDYPAGLGAIINNSKKQVVAVGGNASRSTHPAWDTFRN